MLFLSWPGSWTDALKVGNAAGCAGESKQSLGDNHGTPPKQLRVLAAVLSETVPHGEGAVGGEIYLLRQFGACGSESICRGSSIRDFQR